MSREQLEVDVLFVGAGPASLAGALHLARLVQDHNRAVESGTHQGTRLDPPTILVIEKGKEVGSHALSGAIIDPRAFQELTRGLEAEPPPYDSPVGEEALFILSRNRDFRAPLTPPPLRNHGCYVASLGDIVRWMAGLCERYGVDVYPGFPAVELLFDGACVAGVRIGDKGRDREGKPRPNFEPGIDVKAKITVLGEGPRGTLTRHAEQRLGLTAGKQPQIYSIGVKEIWQAAQDIQPGVVFHTLGFPLSRKDFGGGFIYSRQGNLIDLGFVVGLDCADPRTDGHRLLQQFKTHPFVRALIEGGRCLSFGAKAIPEGGLYAMPRLYAGGLLIVGDAAGFLNAQRLKGIHLAVKSGMLAAETILEALLHRDFSSVRLRSYEGRLETSWAHRELWRVRNFRQSFQRGFWSGLFHTAFQFVTNGRGLKDPMPIQAGHTRMRTLDESFGREPEPTAETGFDGELTFDKLSDVYLSNTAHEEDQPCHLKILDRNICHHRCTWEYGNPCQHFCPAAVYEIVREDREHRLQVNFSNCVHCKTCDIMDPYQIIVWTPPEGGGGPDWKRM